MNEIKTIDFELADVYKNDLRCIYAIVIKSLGRTFLYIGITGSSNNTGISSPLTRLARHIAPSGKTYSIFRGNDTLGEINETSKARFIYTYLPENVLTYTEARRLESKCVSYFSINRELTLLNTLLPDPNNDINQIVQLQDFISCIENALSENFDC